MAIVWFGVIVFLVLLFVFFVPLVNSGNGDLRYANPNMVPRQQPMQPDYPPQQYTPQASRAGCQGILTLLVLAALLFVGAVLFWSVSVQAGLL